MFRAAQSSLSLFQRAPGHKGDTTQDVGRPSFGTLCLHTRNCVLCVCVCSSEVSDMCCEGRKLIKRSTVFWHLTTGSGANCWGSLGCIGGCNARRTGDVAAARNQKREHYNIIIITIMLVHRLARLIDFRRLCSVRRSGLRAHLPVVS